MKGESNLNFITFMLKRLYGEAVPSISTIKKLALPGFEPPIKVIYYSHINSAQFSSGFISSGHTVLFKITHDNN